MRYGYVIRDRYRRGWLADRQRIEPEGKPVTVYVRDPEDALQFRKLADARRMLKLLRSESKRPNAIVIIDPRWRVVT